jgi:integrase
MQLVTLTPCSKARNKRGTFVVARPNLRLVTPEVQTVAPRRASNTQLRTREHLTADEVEKLIETARQNRYGHRDALMVLLAYRHGLRAAEVVDLRWEQIDFKAASLHVRRAKNGTPATHPLSGREMRDYGGINGKTRNRHSCLSRNALRRCRPPASPA